MLVYECCRKVLCMIRKFGKLGGKRSQVSALWQKPGSATEGLSAAEHGWGGKPFGCRSLPPKLKFRLCLGGSAAESAAEPA